MALGVVYISLMELGLDRVELCYGRDNPNQHAPRTLDVGEIADLLKKAEAEYYDVRTPDLIDIGKRLYRWLDGSDVWLAREIKAASGGGPVALLIETAKALGHLPWEVLHDGSEFLVRGAKPAVLPVRWKPATISPVATRDRPLNVLFMATSPLGAKPELDYEVEEGYILEATKTYPLSLTVEETGTLVDLRILINGYPKGHFDVLHLTGHADHRPGGPRFLTESATGDEAWVSASEIAKAVPRRPALTFLSGCKTGQSLQGGAVPSLAETLLEEGFPAVLGWGRKVSDGNATVAAAAIYSQLAAGYDIVESILYAHDLMLQVGSRDWHLLRLFVLGELPSAFISPSSEQGWGRPPEVSHDKRFLDKSRLNADGAVVGRQDFIGRRRPLQRFIRALKGDAHPAGIVIHGIGGVGKSSLACRILDRLGDKFAVAVHVGVLDEMRLLRSLETIPEMEGTQQSALQASTEPLKFRLRAFLNLRAKAKLKPLLLVLDDFEQNLPLTDNQPHITPTAQDVMEALVWAVEESRAGRCLVTCRYELTTTQGAKFYQEQLLSMRATELEKKLRKLENYRGVADDLKPRLDRVADGNPRLMERFDFVLKDKSLDIDALITKLQAVEAEFREQILVASLAAGLSEPTRQLLGGLLVYEQPVPFEAIPPLFPGRVEADILAGLDAASALGLVEVDPQPAGPHYRVPRLLEPVLNPDHTARVDSAASTLFKLWWKRGSTTEQEGLEIARLGRLARRADLAGLVTAALGWGWIRDYRYREARDLYEETIKAIGRDYRLVGGLAEVETTLGDGERSYQLFEEALKGCPAEDDRSKVRLLFPFTRLLIQRGHSDEAVRRLREEQIPAADRLNNSRERAIAQDRIADVLQARGDLDEALRIRRDEELPVFERLGDVRSRAVTLGKIADVLQARGELDEALRIRRDEELPVYERLGDVRSRAVTLGKIADVLQDRGELDEALRIRRDEELPVYERLGDVRERAVTLGQIADILQDRGELDEALRIRREEQIPVYERLGDVRSRAVTLGKIADVLQARGELDEALRIRRDEELPVYERLGDVRERAVTLGQIADILQDRGELDEALRIRREEQIPVYERLGDVRERAVAYANIAGTLAKRGELDEAIRILVDESLQPLRKLGEPRSLARSLLLLGVYSLQSGRPEDGARYLAEALPFAIRGEDRETAAMIRKFLGLDGSAER